MVQALSKSFSNILLKEDEVIKLNELIEDEDQNKAISQWTSVISKKKAAELILSESLGAEYIEKKKYCIRNKMDEILMPCMVDPVPTTESCEEATQDILQALEIVNI